MATRSEKQESEFSVVGCVHKFLIAAERWGITKSMLNAAAQDKTGMLAKFRAVIEGRAEIKIHKHVVDLSLDAFDPEGHEVISHKRSGLLDLSTATTKIVLVKVPEKDGRGGGHAALEQLAAETAQTFNANLLDYWYENQEIIPEEFKKVSYICFPDTIYRFDELRHSVRGLYWHHGRWNQNHKLLGYPLPLGCSAAVLTSST